MSEDKQKVTLYMKEEDGSFWTIKDYLPVTCQYAAVKIDEVILWEENEYINVSHYIDKLKRIIEHQKKKIKLIEEFL